MSSDRIFLTREEQSWLMDMLEMNDPTDAVERFATIMIEERLDPENLHECLKKLMARHKKL